MNRLRLKERLFLLISFLYITYIIFPIFADITQIPVYIPCLVIVGALAVLYPPAFWSAPMKWLFVYGFFLILYAALGHPIHINGVNSDLPASWRVIIEMAWMMPGIAIFCVLSYLKNERLYKFIGYGAIVLFVISFLYILPIISSSTNILRENISEEIDDRPLGFPSYALMHSYTLIIPGLLLAVRRNTGTRRLVAIALSFLFAYVIVKTAVTTSLIVLLITILFGIFFNKKNKSRNITIFSALGILLVILYHTGLFLMLVDGLIPYFEGTAVEFKLLDMHDSLIRGQITGGSITGRLDYHEISINSFFTNPFLGTGVAGGHSKILDILGSMGIIMFIPFFMMIWSVLRSTLHVASEKELRAFLLFGFMIAFIYLYEKGIFSDAGWLSLTVLLPCVILAQQDRSGERKRS